MECDWLDFQSGLIVLLKYFFKLTNWEDFFGLRLPHLAKVFGKMLWTEVVVGVIRMISFLRGCFGIYFWISSSLQQEIVVLARFP